MIQTLKQYKFLSVLCCVVFAALIIQGPYLPSDSGGYLEASAARGLLYPLFLNICRFVWDNLYGVVFVQLVLGLGACFYSIGCFAKLFEKRFGTFLQIGLFVAIALPYIGHTTIGNTILTEPLAYPLFLLFFCQLLLWKKFEDTRHFFIALGLALCLMLTRKQLGFVFSGFYILIFLDFIQTKKIKILSFLLPMLFFGTGLLIEKSYMHIKTGHFTSTPSGIFIMASPLYIAKTSDIDLLRTPEQKHFLKKALKDRDRQKLSMHQELYANFTWPYHKKFEIIHDVFSYEIVGKALQGLKLDSLEREEFLKEVSFTLIKNNLVSFFKFYYHNVINNMGGYYYFYAVCCAFFMCFWQIVFKVRNILLYFGLLSTSLQFLNYGIVAIFLPVLRRYAIYTDGLMICFWLLCLHLVFASKRND